MFTQMFMSISLWQFLIFYEFTMLSAAGQLQEWTDQKHSDIIFWKIAVNITYAKQRQCIGYSEFLFPKSYAVISQQHGLKFKRIF